MMHPYSKTKKQRRFERQAAKRQRQRELIQKGLEAERAEKRARICNPGYACLTCKYHDCKASVRSIPQTKEESRMLKVAKFRKHKKVAL